jgi:hypothetical protein
VFVVDSSVDADGKFADGYFSYAEVGGPYVVMTYDNDGHGISNMGKVFAHETGHVFYALDEYNQGGAGDSYNAGSGYYNTQNLNAAKDRPVGAPPQVASLMADGALVDTAYANHSSSPTSLQMLGWQDSDGDHIIDVLDVALTLTGASGSYYPATSTYVFSGTSTVPTLNNQNPRGLGNDITLNEVDHLQYRIDGGVWTNVNATPYHTASQTFTNIAVSVPLSWDLIEFRTVANDSGVTSPTFAATNDTEPEVAVTANGQNIADGDATPSASDWTDFGMSVAPVERTFTVSNPGTDVLILSGLQVPSGFSVVEGLAATLVPGASDTFTVRFLATTDGWGQVSFNTNDADEATFNFTIAGVVLHPPPQPANPQATAFSSTRIELGWDDMSGDEDGFKVEIATSPSGPWTPYRSLSANAESCTVKQLLDNTDYYFRVAAFNGDGSSSYVTTTASRTLDNSTYATADDRAKAPVRAHAKDITNFVGDGDPLDYFRFRLAYSGNFTATLDNLQAGEQVAVQLLRSNGTVVDTQSTAISSTPTVKGDWLPAGEYFVGVVRSAPGDNTNYRLMLLADYGGEDIAHANYVGRVPPGGVKKGWLDDGDERDFYKFILASADSVTIEVLGLADDGDAILRNATGKEIARSKPGAAADDTISRNLAAGTYYIEVLRLKPVAASYVLNVGLS